jgi:hypothetical protein
MNNKVNALVNQYQESLRRKENLVKPYHEKRGKFIDLTENEYSHMLVLESEIRNLENFIADLKYIIEE